MDHTLQLSEGSIRKMLNREVVFKPVLQILSYKSVASNEWTADQYRNRYRFSLTDALNSYDKFLAFSPKVVSKIERAELERYTIVRLENYVININDNYDNLIVIQDLSVITSGSNVGRSLLRNTNAGILSNIGDIANRAQIETNDSHAQQRQQQQQANASTSGVPSTSMSRTNACHNLCPISAITPYYNAWHIKARVISKSSIRNYSTVKGEGHLFSFDVSDNSGEIRFTAFKRECDKFYDLIEANLVYFISKGVVKRANKKYNNLQNDFEITLNEESVIERCDDNEENSDLPKIRFKFIAIKELANCCPQSIVDVLGVCKQIDAITTVMSKKTNKELKKREIILFDKSVHEVRLTLWNKEAEVFDAPIHSVIAVKNALIGEFNGKTLSAISNTAIYKDPDINEADALRGWFIREGLNVNAIPLSRSDEHYDTKWKFLSELQNANENRTYANIKATVMSVGKNPLYKACGFNGCLKKVREVNDIFYCDKCHRESTTFEWRVILSIEINDCTGQTWLSVFQDRAEKLLSLSAVELNNLQTNDIKAFQEVLSALTFKRFYMRIGTKAEVYLDQNRIKSVGYSFTNIEPITEAKRLINFIKSCNEEASTSTSYWR